MAKFTDQSPHVTRSVQLPAVTDKGLRKLAKLRGVPIAQVIRDACAEHIAATK